MSSLTSSRTSSPTSTLIFHPLPAPVPGLDELPADAVRRVTVDVPNSYPCRRCLRDAEPGERVVLLSYNPFLGISPYSQPGPIYLHEAPCHPGEIDAVPDQLTRRVLSVRAFTADHQMTDAVIAPGKELDDVALALFERPDVAYLHVHNAGPGCFAVRIDRG